MSKAPRELAGVPEVLVPYPEFSPTDLAVQLNTAVMQSVELLELRNLCGVIARYSSLEKSTANVRKGQNEHAQIGHFAIVDDTGDVKGSASIYPGLPLRRQRIPLPPRLAFGPLAKDLGKADPNIHAWTSAGEEQLLGAAYQDLVFRSTGWWRRESAPKAWTVEPVDSPDEIHEAIASSGLRKVGRGRYDDGESRTSIPKTSILYANTYSTWSSRHGGEKELAKGSKSLATILSEGTDELLSTNPHG